jgi:alcohol dehydrogenase
VTGLDCISHALESAVSSARTPFSQVFSAEAWRLASASFERVVTAPGDLDALADMQRAAAFAGLAIEHSMLGAAHAMANPLTASFGVIHGEAVGTMLPHVVRFNAETEEARATYERFAGAAEISGGVDALVTWLRRAVELAGLPGRLRTYGVASDSIGELAEGAARQWTGRFNPRSVADDQWRALYESAL